MQNTKIKKTTLYFIPKISCERWSYTCGATSQVLGLETINRAHQSFSENFNLSNFKLLNQLMEPPFSFSCVLRFWLNHEFGGFWFQGETFLSSIFVKLGKQVPFHVYIHLMSFSSLSHLTHFCLVTVKTCHWKWGIPRAIILNQTVFALFYRFTMALSKGFRMPPFNHVHVLSETVN